MDRMQIRSRLTYANVASTLALFLALTGSVAFAASKIQSGDIARNAVKSANLARGAVKTSNVFRRAITSGKLATGAVRSNQIADGAVGAKQIGQTAVAPSNLQFPVYFVASPSGGSAPISQTFDPYPIAGGTWTQKPGEIEVVFGAAAATLAYDGSGSGSCQVYFEINLNGKQVGGGEVSTSSTSLQQVEGSVGAQPQIDPLVPITNQLTARTGSNGDCTPDSKIDSTRFRVLDFG